MRLADEFVPVFWAVVGEWEALTGYDSARDCDEGHASWLAFLDGELEAGKITQREFDHMPKGRCGK